MVNYLLSKAWPHPLERRAALAASDSQHHLQKCRRAAKKEPASGARAVSPTSYERRARGPTDPSILFFNTRARRSEH